MKNLKTGDLLINKDGIKCRFERYDPHNNAFIYVTFIKDKPISGLYPADDFKRKPKDEVFIKSNASGDSNEHEDKLKTSGIKPFIEATFFSKPYSVGAFVVHKKCPIDWAIVEEITGNYFKANYCSECTYGCESLKVSDYRVASKLEESLIILSLKCRK